MNIGLLLKQLAVDLNDAAPGHENTTWSRSQLRAYLEEAMSIVFIERPDLFIETRVIKVQPCTVVQDTCDCEHVRRVIGQSTKDGRILKYLRPKKAPDRLVWTGRVCRSRVQDFSLSQYYIDDVTNKLWLFPQMPAGLDIYVAVECAVAPSDFSDSASIPDAVQAAVVQWVLYRAKMVDGEYNPVIVQVANQHYQTFWDLIKAAVVRSDIIVEKSNEHSV